MPWTAADAPSHNAKTKGKPALQKAWAKAANAALDEYGDEGKAIAVANATVDKMASDKKRELTDEDVIAYREAVEAEMTMVAQAYGAVTDHMARSTLDRVDMYTRDAQLSLTAPKSYDAATREADAVISTGSRVRRRDWDGEFDEVLEVSPGAVRMSRLNNGAQLIDSHNWYRGLDAILGAVVPGSARIEKGKVIARFRFSRSENGQRVAQDLEDGIPILLSAGYKIHKFVQDDSSSPPTRMITDWEPLEVSVVTVSAEEVGAGFRSHPAASRKPPGPGTGDSQMKKPVRRIGESDADFQKRVAAWLQKHQPVENETDEAFNQRVAEYVTQADAAAAAATRADDKGGGDKGTNKKAKDRKKGDDGEDEDEDEDKEGTGKDGEDDEEDDNKDKKRGADKAGTADRGGANIPAAAQIMAIGRQAQMPTDQIEAALRENVGVDAFRVRAFDYLAGVSAGRGLQGGANGEASDHGTTGAGGVDVIRDELTGRSAAMAEALIVRALSARRTPAITTPEQAEWAKLRGLTDEVARSFRVYDGHEQFRNAQARQYMGMSLVEIAAECINYKHRGLVTQQRAYDIVRRAFQSTSDFPAIYENVLNKVLLARYQLAMPTYREIAIERPFNDFRPHPQVRAGDFPLPMPLTEGGEIRIGRTLDSKESVAVVPYGVGFNITRQMIVNDELGAIDTVLASAGDAVLVFENTTFFAMFFQTNSGRSPTLLQDNLPVFTSGAVAIPPAAPVGHNNLATGGDVGAPSITTIGKARAALRGMKSLSGYFLNIPPRVILTGPTQETAADQMVTAITPTLTTSVNPFSGRLRSISDANITDSSWYLLAEPGRLPCYVYGFLAGSVGPRVRTEEPFGMQGVRVSLEHDFGCGAIDYRGAYKNPGQ